MRVEDFMTYFTQLVVCREFPNHYFGVEYEQVWNVTTGFVS